MLDLAQDRTHRNIIPFAPELRRETTVLIVEDDRLQRSFLERHITEIGYQIREAENGLQAIEMLEAEKSGIDVIVMDRIMPVMNGMEAIHRIKENKALKSIPVIMVTGASSAHEMQEGIEAGVFYYLSKPVDNRVLESVLQAAMREAEQNRLLSQELKRQRTCFNLMQSCKFTYATLDEAESLAAFLAHSFPEPERTLPGIAELLINAVEHGNLDIGYEMKTRLIEDGTWRAEVERRQALAPYSTRACEVVLARRDGGVYMIVTDQGRGFDWKSYMTINPARAGDNHGRGIAQANALSFDRLTYNAQGNQAIAFVGNELPLQW